MKKYLIILFLACSNLVFAAESIRIISDAEIESKLKSFISPLVKAAKLDPEDINIRIIVDNSLNAFVTNGKDVYINTGLIVKFAYDPNVLYAVLAHEIAHIYAGHLIQFRGQIDQMTGMAVGGALLGLATIVAGAPEAGMFIGAAAANVGQREILQYSREHEVEADKIAVELLYKTHNNGSGLITFFKYLSQTDRQYDPDPYLITHPLSAARIASVQNSIEEKLSSFGDNITPQIKFDFRRMAMKLESFLGEPSAVVAKYKDPYPLSIGYFRLGNFDKANSLIDQELAKFNNDPYLWELKAQFYFDNGKFEQATNYYKKSLSGAPRDKILKTELAASQINQAKEKDVALLNNAVSLLHQVTAREPSLMAYFMLSRAYGKLGNQVKAMSALAEYYFYQGAYGKSRILAKKILKMSSEGSKEYIRASDIVDYVNDAEKERKID